MLAITQEITAIGTSAVAPIVHPPITTTLYALIETLQDSMVPEDDAVKFRLMVRPSHDLGE